MSRISIAGYGGKVESKFEVKGKLIRGTVLSRKTQSQAHMLEPRNSVMAWLDGLPFDL